MATIDFNQRDEGKKPFRRTILKIVMIPLFMVLIGVLASMAYTVYRSGYGSFKDCEVITSVERSDGTSAVYRSYGNVLLGFSRDGATTLDKKGQYLWSGSYEMKDPIADTCGDYVIVGDRGDKQVYLFDNEGLVKNLNVEYPILHVQVASQGVMAIMMEEDNYVYIDIYKSDGGLIWSQMKSISATGFPLSMALSHDGNKMVTSYLDVASGSLKTNVACYNFDEVGKNTDENFVGGIIIEGNIAAKVDFITNDIIGMFRDDGMSMYKMERKLDETAILEANFDTGIQSIFSSGSYVGFVLDTAEDEYKYKVVVYDTDGSKVLEKGINFDYSNVTIKDSDIIFYNYSECMILSTRGKIRFQHKFEDSIDYMFGAGKNQYYVVHSNSIDIIQLKGAK